MQPKNLRISSSHYHFDYEGEHDAHPDVFVHFGKVLPPTQTHITERVLMIFELLIVNY